MLNRTLNLLLRLSRLQLILITVLFAVLQLKATCLLLSQAWVFAVGRAANDKLPVSETESESIFRFSAGLVGLFSVTISLFQFGYLLFPASFPNWEPDDFNLVILWTSGVVVLGYLYSCYFAARLILKLVYGEASLGLLVGGTLLFALFLVAVWHVQPRVKEWSLKANY